MLPLRARIPHHVLTSLHSLPLLAHNHRQTWVHCRPSPTANGASLCGCHDSHRHSCRSRRKDAKESPVLDRLLFSRHNRIYYSANCTIEETRSLILRNHIGGSWDLSELRNRVELAYCKRLGSIETRNSNGNDNHCRKSRCSDRNAAL